MTSEQLAEHVRASQASLLQANLLGICMVQMKG
jgi:hypothetical protein